MGFLMAFLHKSNEQFCALHQIKFPVAFDNVNGNLEMSLCLSYFACFPIENGCLIIIRQ